MKKLIGVIVILALVLFLALQPRIKKMPEYSIVFYSNQGTEIKTMYVKSNEFANQPRDPHRVASEFVGWYTSNQFKDDELFDFETTRITKSITLFAKWEAAPFHLIYEIGEEASWPEGGEERFVTEFNIESQTIFLSIAGSNPVHEGGIRNRFDGWRTIPQSEFNQLTEEEQKDYPLLLQIVPKEDLDLFEDGNTITLYAQYRGK